MKYTIQDYLDAGFDQRVVRDFIEPALAVPVMTEKRMDIVFDFNSPKRFNYDVYAALYQALLDSTISDEQLGALTNTRYSDDTIVYATEALKLDKANKFLNILKKDIYTGDRIIQISLLIKYNHNYDFLLDRNFGRDAATIIVRALTHNEITDADVAEFADPKFDAGQIRELVNGATKHLDISWYNDPEFSRSQMNIIRGGLENGIDVSWFADPSFSWKQMDALEICIFNGMTDTDLSKIAYPRVPKADLVVISELTRLGLKNAVPLYKKYKSDIMTMLDSPELKAFEKDKRFDFAKGAYELEDMRNIYKNY